MNDEFGPDNAGAEVVNGELAADTSVAEVVNGEILPDSAGLAEFSAVLAVYRLGITAM